MDPQALAFQLANNPYVQKLANLALQQCQQVPRNDVSSSQPAAAVGSNIDSALEAADAAIASGLLEDDAEALRMALISRHGPKQEGDDCPSPWQGPQAGDFRKRLKKAIGELLPVAIKCDAVACLTALLDWKLSLAGEGRAGLPQTSKEEERRTGDAEEEGAQEAEDVALLHAAATHGSMNCLKWLLKRDAGSERADRSRKTATVMAVHYLG